MSDTILGEVSMDVLLLLSEEFGDLLVDFWA